MHVAHQIYITVRSLQPTPTPTLTSYFGFYVSCATGTGYPSTSLNQEHKTFRDKLNEHSKTSTITNANSITYTLILSPPRSCVIYSCQRPMRLRFISISLYFFSRNDVLRIFQSFSLHFIRCGICVRPRNPS